MEIDEAKAGLKRIIAAGSGIVKRPKLTRKQVQAMGGRARKGKPSNNPNGRPVDPASKSRRSGYRESLRKAKKAAGRTCDVKECWRLTEGGPLCSRHEQRRRYKGHHSVSRLPGRKELLPLVPLVHAWLTAHPVPSEVLHALQGKVLSPSATLTLNQRQGWQREVIDRARHKARAALEALFDQGRQKRNGPHRRKPSRRKPTTPMHIGGQYKQTLKRAWGDGFGKSGPHARTIVVVLLCLTVWMDERSWGAGWAEHAAVGKMVLQRVKWFGRFGQLRGQPLRYVGQLVSETIGVYLLGEARKITEYAKTYRRPKRGKQQPAVVVGPRPPQHPGPEPTYSKLEDWAKHREWLRKKAAYERYLETGSIGPPAPLRYTL